MKPFHNTCLSIFMCVGILSSYSAFAEDVSEASSQEKTGKGFVIAKEVQDRDSGWGATTSEMTMVLSNKKGRKSEREMSMKNLEVTGDGDKSLTIFDEPRDVKGTAFLSFSHALEADQQWLYLPALKRVKRISSSNKSGPFLGSEFAFEDLSSFEIEKYDYEFIKEEKSNGVDVYVVKYVPQYEHSGYKFMHVYIDKEKYVFQKIDYFDRKGDMLKTLDFNDYKQFKEKYWRALNYLVVNHQTGKKTELKWRDFNFDVDLTESDFNQNALKRSR